MSYTSEFYAALRKLQNQTGANTPDAHVESGAADNPQPTAPKTVDTSDYTARFYAALKNPAANRLSPDEKPLSAEQQAVNAENALKTYREQQARDPGSAFSQTSGPVFDMGQIGAMFGNFLRTGTFSGDEKEAALKAQADAARAKADHVANEAVAAGDRAQIDKMDASARRALETYATWRSDNLGKLVSFAQGNVTDPLHKQAQDALQQLLNMGYSQKQVEELAETWSRDYNAKVAGELSDMGKKDASLLNAIGTIPLSVVGGITGAVDQTMEVLKGNSGRYVSLDPNRPGTANDSYSDALREEEGKNVAGWAGAAVEAQGGSEKAQEVAGTVAQTVYSAGLSAAENLAKVATVGGAASLALSGTAAYSRAMREASRKGATPAQAMLMGVFTGGLEALTEKLPLDNLMGQISKAASGGIPAVKVVLKDLFTQGAQEVTEEELNFLAGIFLQAAILGEKSDTSTAVSQLMENGLSYEAARAQVNADTWNQALSTAAQSFLSGIISSGTVQLAGATGTPISTPTVEQDTTPTDAPDAPQTVDPTDYATRFYAALNRLTRDSQTEKPAQDAQTPTQTQTAPTAPQNGDASAVSGSPVAQKNAASEETTVNITSAGSALTEQNKEKNTLAYTLASNLDTMRDMRPVSQLTGREFNDRGKKISEQIRDFFRSLGNKVSRNGLGDVDLGEYGIGGMLNHRPINRAKVVSLAAVPDVIKNGRQISYDPNWKGRGYESYTFAAPVSVNGTPVYVAAVVNKLPDNRFYLSEMVDSNGNYVRIEESPSGNSKNGLPMGPEIQQGRDYAGPEGLSEGDSPAASAAPMSAFNDSISETPPVVNTSTENSQQTPAHESVGAADQNFTGKAAYQDLLTDENTQRDRPGDVRPMEVPKVDGYGRHVSEFVGNAYGSRVVTDDFAGTIEELVQEGALGYDVKTNAQSLQEASARIKEKGKASVRNAITKNIANGKVGDTDIASAMLLFSKYSAGKSQSSQDNAAELFVDLQMMATQTGRDLQLFKMLRKLTPQGQLMAVTKNVERYIDSINKNRSDKTRADVTIPRELQEEYMQAAQDAAVTDTPENQRRKEEAEQAIYAYAASNIKATLKEKWDAWRYLAMLGNPKTQIRNVLGNALFRPFVETKKIIGAAIESMVLKPEQRSKALLGLDTESMALRKWAALDARTADVTSRMSYTATTGDAARTQIDDQRKIFDNGLLEKARTGLGDLMEAEDMLFKRSNYSDALASFLKARGITAQQLESGNVPESTLSAARSYAVQEAMKATFNDQNALSNMLVNMRYKGDNPVGKVLNAAAEGILPFRRTPANIVVRAAEYSPAALVRSITTDAAKVRSGEISAAEYIDHLAAGLTGTGAMALGWALAAGLFQGVRLVGNEEDEDEKRQGHQSYALEVGDTSIPIDWAAPAVLPLFMGANLYQSLNANEENVRTNAFTAFLEATANTLEPMLELSCLSSLNDLLTDARYAQEGREVYSIAASIATSYFLQGLPTLGGQIEQAFESEKKSVYADSADPVGKELQQVVGRATQKIPGIDLFQTEKVDAWGRTVGDKSVASDIFDAFINPSKVSKITETAADQEISRLNKVQSKNVSPDTPAKKISYTGTDGTVHTDYTLSAEEYTAVAKAQGQLSKTLADQIIASDAYAALSDDQKAAALGYAYAYARDSARTEVLADYPGFSAKWMAELPEDADVAEAIIRYSALGSTTKYSSLPVEIAAQAFELLEALKDQPRETKPDGTSYSGVRDVQQVEAVTGSSLSEEHQTQIMKDILTESAYEKYEKVLAAGYNNDQYALLLRLYQDTEKTQYQTKKENTIRSIMKQAKVTRTVAQKLYDIYAGQDEKKTEKSNKPLSSFLGK